MLVHIQALVSLAMLLHGLTMLAGTVRVVTPLLAGLLRVLAG